MATEMLAGLDEDETLGLALEAGGAPRGEAASGRGRPSAEWSLTDLAAAIWVYRETGSALAVGLTLMVTAIPSLIVGLLAGVYVDRHDRRRIMIISSLIQGVVVAVLALAVQANWVLGLYVLLLLNAGIKQFFDPAYESLIPELATDDELNAAATVGVLTPPRRKVHAWPRKPNWSNWKRGARN